MPTALTIIRHLAAVIAAWLTTTLIGMLGLDVGPETLAEVQGALTTLGGAVLLALYAVVEKALKPLFHRLGEPRPVEVDLQGLNPDVLSALAGRVQSRQQNTSFGPCKLCGAVAGQPCYPSCHSGGWQGR